MNTWKVVRAALFGIAVGLALGWFSFVPDTPDTGGSDDIIFEFDDAMWIEPQLTRFVGGGIDSAVYWHDTGTMDVHTDASWVSGWPCRAPTPLAECCHEAITMLRDAPADLCPMMR